MTDKTALLVIDVQVSMFEPPEFPHQHEDVLSNIKSLIDKARRAGTPVIYVQHDHTTYQPMMRGEPGWRIQPAVAPLPTETVVHKQASDSFYQTNLRRELDALGIKHLVITGLQTELCVDATCRRAISEDYQVTVVSDGHTTWDGDVASAAQIIDLTNAHLANLAHPTQTIELKTAAEVAF